MPSPFPGMDPFIEACHLWEDFHGKLIGDIERELSQRVPERYAVRTGERSYVAVAQIDDEPDQSHFVPDVAVTSSRGVKRRPRKSQGPAPAADLPATPGAVLMRPLIKADYREAFLEIRQVEPGHKLVTGIEVLSPSNKRPGTKGWRLYYRKRLAYLGGYANLVEIDLLRGGRRMPMFSPWPDGPYYLLTKYKARRLCVVWPAHSVAPLPPLTVPLAPPDPDISLDLQPLVDAIYARSRYERDIDYRRPLTPPLPPAEQAWLDERLRERPTNA
jgi:Protein of unknown function (DUF4058)